MRGRRRRPVLSVVMPCLDEAETVAACVREARAGIRQSGVPGEVVIADNGSTDGSRRLAAAAGARVVRVGEKGYGAAIRGGIAAARGRWLLMGDSDLSYDFSAIPSFVAELRRGVDLVRGTRLGGRILPGAMPWTHRVIGTPFLNLALWILFRFRVSDSQCGMRAFTRRAWDRLALRSPGMEFASEMLAMAARQRLTMTEVPITYRPAGRRRPPHLRALADGWRHLRLMLFLAPASILLVPGILASLAGAGMVVASGFHVAILGHPLDVHVAIGGSALVLIGYQVVHLGLCIAFLREEEESSGWPRAWLGLLSLERTLMVGGLLMAAGLATGLQVLGSWLSRGFPPLSSQTTIIGVFGMTLVLLGVQTVAGGFYIAAGLEPSFAGRRHDDPPR